MVERVHRQIEEALRAREAGSVWHGHLPWVLLGIRAASKEVSGVSSAKMVFGQPLHLPGEFLQPPEELATSGQPPAPSYAMVADTPPPHLVSAQYMYVRRGGMGKPLEPLYAGPYEVIEKHARTFVLRVGARLEVVSMDWLKPHLGTGPVVPASPPARGRPPA
jgi:hypothetical protein